MAFTKKTWTDRQAEYPGRRKLTATATADVYDVTREEGLVVEEGDALNATNLNNLETRIEAGLNEKADGIHTHGIADVSGIVPVIQGGTGQTTLAAARNAMGLGNTTGALPVANGGTPQALPVLQWATPQSGIITPSGRAHKLLMMRLPVNHLLRFTL